MKRTTSRIRLHGIKLNSVSVPVLDLIKTAFNLLGLRSTMLSWPGSQWFLLKNPLGQTTTLFLNFQFNVVRLTWALQTGIVIAEKLWKCCCLITQNTLQPQVCSDPHPVPSHHGITASLQTFLHNSANIWQHEVWCVLWEMSETARQAVALCLTGQCENPK